jgi:hypothetical protein
VFYYADVEELTYNKRTIVFGQFLSYEEYKSGEYVTIKPLRILILYSEHFIFFLAYEWAQ